MHKEGRSPNCLPLFVFPTSVTFYTDDVASHQQVITVYNPYNFILRYKVLCTAPKKYRVSESEGSIKSRCCVDIFIKHRDVCLSNENIRDKFRLQVSEFGQKAILGKRDIVSVLLPTKDQSVSNSADEQFESIPTTTTTSRLQATNSQQHRSMVQGIQGTSSSPSWIVLLAAVLCIVILMLPTDGSSTFTEYIHVTFHQKLIASYILGLVTMVILRS
jgi:hypothetical protein